MKRRRGLILLVFILLYVQFLPFQTIGDATEEPRSNNIPVIHYSGVKEKYCAPACIQMALGYLTYPDDPPSQDVIALWVDTDIKKGTFTDKMSKAFHKMGFKAYEKYPLSLNDLKQYNEKGYLAILLIYFGVDLKDSSWQHFVLVTGFDENGIYVHDPTTIWIDDRETGPNAYIPNEILLELWNCELPFWGLVIPYEAKRESRYKCTINIERLPSDITTILYVDDEFQDTVVGESSVTYDFTIGSKHKIRVEPFINGTWTKEKRTEYRWDRDPFVFYSWNEDKEFTFLYDEIITYYHYLEVKSEYGDPQGSGWYEEDSFATISIDQTPVKIDEGIRNLIYRYEVYRAFDHWSGDFTCETSICKIQMDSPKTVSAVWKTEETEYTDYGLVMPFIYASVIIVIACICALIVWRKKKSKMS